MTQLAAALHNPPPEPPEVPPPPAVADMIALAQQGNTDARSQLLTQLQDVIYRFCLSLLRDPDTAKDATQETAVRFLQHLPKYKGQSQLRTWTLGIALNVCREHRRRRAVPSNHQLPDAATDEPSPASNISTAEQHARLHALLTDLPERQREAIILRYFEQLSIDQTAHAMDCAAGTVKATIWQALRNLKQRWSRPA